MKKISSNIWQIQKTFLYLHHIYKDNEKFIKFTGKYLPYGYSPIFEHNFIKDVHN